MTSWNRFGLPLIASRLFLVGLLSASLVGVVPAPLLAGVTDLGTNLANTAIAPNDGETVISTGTVSGAGTLNVRTGPWGEIVDKIHEGDPVEIVGSDGEWLKVKHNGAIRYVHSAYIDPRDAKLKKYDAWTGTVDTPGDVLNVRTGPWGEIIGHLGHGSHIEVLGQEGDWLKVSYNGRPAMIHKDYVRRPGQGPKPPAANPGGSNPKPPNEGTPPSSPGGADPRFASSIAWGKAQMGSGNWSGWCLKFVANVYGAPAAGFESAYSCYQAIGKHDSVNNVPNIPVGALVFFDSWSSGHHYGHVGINLGNGMMLDTANNGGHVGIQKINGPYWGSRYLGWAMPPKNWPGR